MANSLVSCLISVHILMMHKNEAKSLRKVAPANNKLSKFPTYTAACHQGATQMLWLHFWQLVDQRSKTGKSITR